VASKNSERAGKSEFLDRLPLNRRHAYVRAICHLGVARRFRSRADVELENLSVSIVPRCSLEREGPDFPGESLLRNRVHE